MLGRYIVYGQGGCMYSECMYVLGVEKIVYGQNFVSAFQSLFLCNTETVICSCDTVVEMVYETEFE